MIICSVYLNALFVCLFVVLLAFNLFNVGFLTGSAIRRLLYRFVCFFDTAACILLGDSKFRQPELNTMASPGVMFRRMVGSVDQRSCWILHGLLGQGRNWQSVANTLAAKTDLSYVMLDLRNHGHSHGFQPPHTMDACVTDLVECGRQALLSPTALVGHSFGGKVLLQLAKSPDALRLLTQYPVDRRGTMSGDRALQLFIVDSFPGALRHTNRNTADELDGVFDVLDFVTHTPESMPSKQWMLNECKTRGISTGVAHWLATNLTQLPAHERRVHGKGALAPSGESETGAGGGFHWVFEPTAAKTMFESHNSSNCWDVLIDGPPAGVDIHLIMASKSTRWQGTTTRDLLAKVSHAQAAFHSSRSPASRGNVFQHTVEAGHWIHSDNPSALVEIISAGLHGVGQRSIQHSQ